MRKVAAILLSAVMALSVTACGSSETSGQGSTAAEGQVSSQKDSEDGIKIGVSAPDLTNVFFIQIKEAMEASLKGENDEIIIQDAAGDQNKQMNDVADMINQGCDVICISAINSEGVRATLEACKEASISKLAIGIPSTNQQIHTDRPPLNCRDLLQKTA